MIPLRWLIVGALALIVFVVGYTLANQFPPPTIRVTPPLTNRQQTRTPTPEERQAQVVTLTNETEGEPVVFLLLPTSSPASSPRASATSESHATATVPVKPSATAEPNTSTPITLPTPTAEVTVPVPPSGAPQIVRFELDTSSVAWDGTVTATWDTTGYEMVSILITQVDDEFGAPFSAPGEMVEGLPAKGSRSFKLTELLAGRCAVPTLKWELNANNFTAGNFDTAIQQLSVDLSGYPVVLDSITTSPNPVPSNGTVTLTYSGRGGSQLLLYQDYFLSGGYEYDWVNVGKYWGEMRLTGENGTYPIRLPNRHIAHTKYSVVYGQPNGPTVCSTYSLDMSCPYTYWIDEPQEQTEESCPTSDKVTVPGSYQRFEHGVMVWDGDLKRIHVLYDDGTNTFYYDQWQGGPLTYPSEPPTGMIAPSQGFGYIWTTHPDMQSKLGWATAAEQPYSMTRQWVKNGYQGFYDNYEIHGPLYLTLPDGQVVRARVEGMWSGRGWEVVS